MLRLITPLWILFVYGYFTWNVLPFIDKEYLLRFGTTIREKLIRRSDLTSNKLSELQNSPSPSGGQAVQSEKSKSPREIVQTNRERVREYKSPFPQPLVNFFVNILRILLLFWILLTAYGWGKKITAWLKLIELNTPFEILMPLGLGFISYLVLIFGAVHLIDRKWQIALLLILFLSAFKECKECLSILQQSAYKWVHGGFKFTFMTGIALVFFTMFFLSAFIPDQFYDTLVYHLALPQTYVNYGKILSLPYNMHFSFPQTAEMLFTQGLAIGGNDTLPLLFQLSFGGLIFMLITKLHGTNYWLPALIWLSCPIVMENLRFAKSDIFFSLMVTLIFILIAQWDQEKGRSQIILAGIFSGLMAGTKYTGLSFILFFFILILIKTGMSHWKRNIKNCAFYLAPTLLIASPWFIKNYLTFENPLYPFFQEFLGYKYMRPVNWQTFINENHQFFGSQWDWTHFIRSFWQNTFYGHEFPSMNFIGPVWLAFSPLMFIVKSSGHVQKYAKIFLLLCYLASTAQTTLARYFLLPVLPVGAFLIFSLIQQSNLKILKLLLLLGIALQMAGCFPLLERVLYGRKALWGLSTEKERKLYPPGYYDAFQWVNANLPTDSMLLFIGETKSHRFQRKVIAPSVHNEHLVSVLTQKSKSSSELYEKLVKLHITHVLINHAELTRIRGYPMFQWHQQDKKILESFWKEHLEDQYSNETITVSQIVERASSMSSYPSNLVQP